MDNGGVVEYGPRRLSIIKDSRQQKDQHKRKDAWFDSMGIHQEVCKLPFGDYSLLYPITVDTKKDLYELDSCLRGEHDRFLREIDGAGFCGQIIYILTETNEVANREELRTWRESDAHLRKRSHGRGKPTRAVGSTMYSSIEGIERSRPWVRFRFCKPEDAGECVLFLLRGGEFTWKDIFRELQRIGQCSMLNLGSLFLLSLRTARSRFKITE